MSQQRPNFFIVLELGFDERDEAAIRSRIGEKQRQWSMDCNHPTKGLQAKQNLALVADMKSVMLDPEAREAEALAARQTVEPLFAFVEQQMQFRTLSGRPLTAKDIEDIANAKEIKGYLNKAAIEKHARDKGYDIQTGQARPTAAHKEYLDKSTASDIQTNLEVVGKQDLYDALGVTPGLALGQIRKLADDLYNKYVAKSPSGPEGAFNIAFKQLAGHARHIFKDEATRARYDNSLERGKLACLDSWIAAVATDRHISVEESETLLLKADEFQVGREAAKEYIREFCRSRGIAIEVAAEAPPKAQCGKCHAFNAPEREHCSQCGFPLRIPCPKCGTLNGSCDAACAHCGFTIGTVVTVRSRMEAARNAMAGKSLDEALALLDGCLLIWPDCPFPELAKELGTVRKAVAARQALFDKTRKAVKARRFLRAKELLGRLRSSWPGAPDLDRYAQQAEERIERAERACRQARTLKGGGKTDDAIDALTRAVEECADYAPALDMLRDLPPDAPSGLAVKPTHRGVSLEWKPSPSRGALVYVVVRKGGSPPTRSAPGERIAELSETQYEDPDAEPGEVYWYRVYASRGSIPSRNASSAAPVVRVADVEELRGEAGNRCATLTWKPLPKARAVEVWRQEGAPPCQPGQGARVADVGNGSASDGNLANGKTYGYLVVARFMDPEGKPLCSRGVAVSLTPSAPPKPISITNLEHLQGRVEVEWERPAAGDVHVYFSAQKPTIRTGDSVKHHQLAALGKRAAAMSATKASVPVSPRETVHIVPVTVVGSVAVAGAPTVFSHVEDVTDTRAYIHGEQIAVQWAWPEGVSLARVSLRGDKFADSPSDTQAKHFNCDKGTYERDGRFVVAAPEVKDACITVYSCVAGNGQDQFAPGASKGARTKVAVRSNRRVEYRVRPVRKWLGMKGTSDFEIALTCDKPVALPALKVVAKAGGVPIGPDDGVEILKLPEGINCEKGRAFKHRFHFEGLPPKAKAKVYPVDDEDRHWLDLRGVPTAAQPLG